MENRQYEGKSGPHTIKLNERKMLEMSGIDDVVSFDENCITLKTPLGTLTVDGQEMHIQSMDVERGELSVSGRILGLYYVEKAAKKGGFFSKNSGK